MDSFDEKRGMVAKLLAMLKDHASNEVNSGLQKPEGEDDMHGLQVEKVEVLPEHEMDKATPDHEVDTKLIDEGKHTSSAGYNKGGYVDAPEKAIPYESADGQPDKQGAVHKEVGESLAERDAKTTTEHEEPLGTEYPEAEPEPSSMFQSFLSKKRKK